MNPCRPIAALLASVSALAAQDTPTLKARSFLPAEHTLAASIDVEALLDTGLYDVLERSPAKMVLEEFRKTFGFRIDDLTRFEAAMRFNTEAEDPDERQSAVIVLEGDEHVQLDDDVGSRLGGRYEWTDIAGHRVLTGTEPAMLTLRPGLVVFGDSHHIEGILRGELRGGVPAPELMPLIAGGKALARFAMLLDTTDSKRLWPDELSDPDDPTRSLAARLARREGDGHIVLTARVGFATGASGPATLSAKIDEGIAQAKAAPEMRMMLPLLERLVKKQAEKELILELDLGKSGAELAQMMQSLVMGVLVPRRAAAQAMAVAAEARAAEVEKVVKRMQEVRKAAEEKEEEKKKEKEKEKK